jgi:hypothetical protein
MTEGPPRERKRLLKKAFKAAERKSEIASSPLPLSELRALLDAVADPVLGDQGRNLCDRTHRFTRFSLQAHGMSNIDDVMAFLRNKGFSCDCEVALNLGSWLEENEPSRGTRQR